MRFSTMRKDELAELADPLHTNLGIDEDGRLEPTVQPDWDSIDRNVFGVEPDEERDAVVSFADMAAALSLIVSWACASRNLTHVGARIASLAVLLDPNNAGPSKKRWTLADIAREAGITRSAISRWLVDFRDSAGTSLTVGKRSSMRAKYRQSQAEAVERHTHSSFVRRDKTSA